MNKIYFSVLFILGISTATFSQNNIGIGTNTPNPNAKLDISSTTKGLLIPRMTSAQRTTLAGTLGLSDEGLMVYDTDLQKFYYWDKNIGFSGNWNQVRPGSLSNGTIWIGDASNIAVENTMNGDATISNTGVLDLTNSAVETSEINNNAVTGTKIDISGNTNGSIMYYDGTDWVNLGPGTAGQILQTNGAGAPTWVNAISTITRSSVTTSTTGVTIGSGSNQVVGGTNMTIDVASNSATSPGLVASGASQVTKVWGTDASGNPSWVDVGTVLDAQNGLNVSTTAPNASATTPYVELGGGLVRNTTITQGNFNYIHDLTGTGIYRINHVNTSAATQSTYPFAISRGGITDYTVGSDASYIYNQTWNSKPLQINSQGNNVLINPNTGNVGIGLLTPSNKLDIASAVRSGIHATGLPLYVTGTLSSGAPSGGGGIEFRHDNGTQGIGFGFNTIYATGSNATQDLGFASRSTGNLNYYTNGLQRMIILGSNGNVGIGTTTPIQNLDVNGRINVASGVIQRGTTAITGTADLGLYSQVGGNWIRIVSNAAPIRFFTDQGGAGGIGTNAVMSVESSNGGGVAINAEIGGTGAVSFADARAALDVQSTSKGMLTPRLTTTQRDAMGGSLAEGLLIYNTTNDCFEFWDTKSNPRGLGGFWNSLCNYCDEIVVINSNQVGYNLNSALGGAKVKNYCVYVSAGVTLQAAGASGTAFNASTMPTGSKVTLYNYGNILAGGGNGGQGGQESDGVCSGDAGGGAGGAGGHAITSTTQVTVTVYNYGTIRAGGGGGGGGGWGCCAAGGGGGGGAGTPAGAGGGGNTTNCTSGFVCGCGGSSSAAGNAGAATTGGNGGGGVNRGATGCTCTGNGAGNGGTGGAAGGAGNGGAGSNAGAGGAAGLALQGNGSGSTLNNISGTVTGGVNP